MSEARQGPLAGIRVLELAGLAPGPFAGMMLADHGAEVLRVDRVAAVSDRPRTDVMDRGKHTIGLDLKSPEGVAAFKDLTRGADVVIEVFRPGVAERLGIGPADLHAVNERLIYGRMTGWGQDGPLAPTAGHDIDYIAISGVLSMLGREGDKPTPPINILGDFAGGGLMLAYGVLLALLERGAHRPGAGDRRGHGRRGRHPVRDVLPGRARRAAGVRAAPTCSTPAPPCTTPTRPPTACTWRWARWSRSSGRPW